jgi:hypothetical protein
LQDTARPLKATEFDLHTFNQGDADFSFGASRPCDTERAKRLLMPAVIVLTH